MIFKGLTQLGYTNRLIYTLLTVRGSIRRKVLSQDMATSIGFSLLKVLKDTYSCRTVR